MKLEVKTAKLEHLLAGNFTESYDTQVLKEFLINKDVCDIVYKFNINDLIFYTRKLFKETVGAFLIIIKDVELIFNLIYSVINLPSLRGTVL